MCNEWTDHLKELMSLPYIEEPSQEKIEDPETCVVEEHGQRPCGNCYGSGCEGQQSQSAKQRSEALEELG